MSSLLDITSSSHFLKSFRTTTWAELSNFQDPKQKSDFESYIKIQSLNLPENVAGNHNVCQQF